ncbi:Nucleoside transporter [Mycena sanguinolenta]|uniref:Nucleoside transporter n=1 Tax=Mycena sanguinolenta TaxID=230812 RepID=A0A8H6YAQ9_9AGAR|nr:Nucleoside transporter [Mycena sanguinolenta]
MPQGTVPKAPLTKFLKDRLRAGTTFPWTTNFNHLRRVPRHLKQNSKYVHDSFDPEKKLSVHIPKDRIKFWNIVPGDFVRVRGRYGNKLREVYKIRRLENIVEFPTPENARSPPAYSYASCQLFMGEYEFPPLPGSTEPRRLPVFAERIGTTPPLYNHVSHRWEWQRFATRTNPVIPEHRGEHIIIPWPEVPEKPAPAPAGLYDTPKEEVTRVTYIPPSFSHKLSAPLPRVPTEDEYIAGMAHPTKKPWFGNSPPVEMYLHRELTNPHSRAKKMKRWQSHLTYRKSLLRDYITAEMRELNGRSSKEAKAEAVFKWREKLSAQDEAERRRRWLTLAVAEKAKKKQARKTKREARRRDQLTQLELLEGPNQVIPKDLHP